MRHGYDKVGIEVVVRRWNGYSLVQAYDHLCGQTHHNKCTCENGNIVPLG